MTVHRASRVSHVVNVKDFSASGNGVTDDYVPISSAITSIGANERVLYFPAGTYYIGTSITTPANINVIMDRGAIIQDNATAGITFTINGQLDAGPYQIFNFTGVGSGATFTNGGECWLNWWCDGGTGTSTDPWTSSLDNTNGLQSAHDAGATAIKGTAGYYASSIQADWTNNYVTFKGEGRGATNFIIEGTPTYWLNVEASYLTFYGFTLWGSLDHLYNANYRANSVTAGLNFEEFSRSTLKEVNIDGVKGSAIRWYRAIRSVVNDVEVTYCGDTGKPVWHFDAGLASNADIVQGGHFSAIGFEVNFNDAVWKSESTGGNSDGAVSNTYEGFRFENGTDSWCDVTVTLGTPVNGDAVTITGGITATMEVYVSDATYGDRMRIDSASAYTFGIGDTITGPAGAWTATVDTIDHQNGQFINWNDQGKHRISNMHFNRAGVLASGYSVEVNYSFYCTWNNIRFSGSSDGASSFLIKDSAYTIVNNLLGIGSVGNMDTKRLLEINNSPGISVNNINMRYYGGIKLDGVGSDECLIQGVLIEDAGDLGAGTGIIEIANSGINRCKFLNCHITGSNTAGDAFKSNGANNTYQGCQVTSTTCNYAFNLGGLNDTADGCQVTLLTGTGFYTNRDNVRVVNCTIDSCSKDGINAASGADTFIVQGCRLTGYASAGAGYYGVYIDGANRAYGCQVVNNWFDAEGNSPTYDLQLVDGFANAQIIGNNFENMGTDVRIGSGANKQIYGNVGALENKLSVIPASVPTSGTGEDDLMSVTLPRYSNDVFERIRVRAAGTKTNLNGNKTLKFYFGASSVTFHPAANDEIDWQFEAEIAMYADSAHRCLWTGKHVSITHGYDIFTDDLSAGNITLKVTGECAHADDTITQTMFVVELL